MNILREKAHYLLDTLKVFYMYGSGSGSLERLKYNRVDFSKQQDRTELNVWMVVDIRRIHGNRG